MNKYLIDLHLVGFDFSTGAREENLVVNNKLANICFKNIKFPRGNYQTIVPRQKHSIV